MPASFVASAAVQAIGGRSKNGVCGIVNGAPTSSGESLRETHAEFLSVHSRQATLGCSHEGA